NTPTEAMEHALPVRVRRYALRRGSGGRGRWRGGDGLVREIEVREAAEVTVVSDRRVLAPWGLAGGRPGARGRNSIRRRDGNVEAAPGKFQARLEPGDAV